MALQTSHTVLHCMGQDQSFNKEDLTSYSLLSCYAK